MATNNVENIPSLPAISITQDLNKPRSLLQMAVRRFLNNRLAVLGLITTLVIITIALGADYLAPYNPTLQTSNLNQPPGYVDQNGGVHVLGTDDLGRDQLSRLMFGARISLVVPFVVEAVVILFGVPLGLLAGYYGGIVDDIIMRVTDVMFGFPGLLFVIILIQVTGRSLWAVSFALGFGSWPTMARLVRGQVLQVKEMDYVLGARSIGATPLGLMSRHILPNILGPIIVLVTLDFPGDIIAEATLAFLGLGVDPRTPTWGVMVNAGYGNVITYPIQVVIPAVAIAGLTLALSFVGDGAGDAFDPRTQTD
jgi:ABC-type dipeptide/oligopeptide/nickel transport system permease subunit